jgi:large subunit ribosomal protein L6
MSRIGKAPIIIPDGVKVTINGNVVDVVGPKGALTKTILKNVSVNLVNEQVLVSVNGTSKFDRSYFGTARQLINNMVQGVVNGFVKKLQLVGIGYKAVVNGKNLVLSLGYSHPIDMEIEEGMGVKVADGIITISGIDKEKVGLFAAKIKSKRKPDAYKGKGVRYEGEKIKLKEGKK